MSNHRLSADELNCLLNGPAPDVNESESPSASTGGRITSAARNNPDSQTSAIPTSVSRQAPATAEEREKEKAPRMDAEQWRSFQAIHEVLADRLANAWSEKLRAKIGLRVTNVARLAFGEFAFALDNPTCFLTLDIPPFPHRSCLEFHPTVLFPMIDRLLGGGKKAGPIVRRPLTEIETRLLTRLTSFFFEQFQTAWRPYAAVSPALHKIESNPKLSRCVPAADPVATVEFEVSMPFARGPIRIAYPAASLVSVYDQLSGIESTPLGADLNTVHDVAEIRVLIAERILNSEAPELSLQVGDLLPTGVSAQALAEIQVDGETRFLGRLGQHQGQKAIRIEEVRKLDVEFKRSSTPFSQATSQIAATGP